MQNATFVFEEVQEVFDGGVFCEKTRSEASGCGAEKCEDYENCKRYKITVTLEEVE